jgi:crossover junction endodeoxyribonuclease RusA
VTWLIHVPALPVAQPRQRHTSFGKNYIPKSHPIHAFKAAVMLACDRDGPGEPLQNAVSLRVTFRFPRPKSHWGTGRNAGALKRSAQLRHIQRPDVDNLGKAVMDAMTQAGVWRDDSQACHLTLIKVWCNADEKPGVTIRLETS